MLNAWSGQGRLVRDVEVKQTANGTMIASFTIACDRDYRTKDGERIADFLDVVAWRKSAEFVSEHFHRGDMIVVRGRIQTRSYEDKNGIRRKAVEILGESFYFGGHKRSENANEDTFVRIPDDIDEELGFA